MQGEVSFGLVLGFFMLLGVNGDANLNLLFTDIITKYSLISPTIIYHGEIPEICITRQWLMCLDQEDELEIHPDKDNEKTDKGNAYFTRRFNSSLRFPYHNHPFSGC